MRSWWKFRQELDIDGSAAVRRDGRQVRTQLSSACPTSPGQHHEWPMSNSWLLTRHTCCIFSRICLASMLAPISWMNKLGFGHISQSLEIDIAFCSIELMQNITLDEMFLWSQNLIIALISTFLRTLSKILLFSVKLKFRNPSSKNVVRIRIGFDSRSFDFTIHEACIFHGLKS